MLNYNHLYYFHVAAIERSIGAAATRLGVKQPTISEQIRALERELGVCLFERHSTGLTLTEAGRATFERTSVMFREGEHLLHDLKRTSSEHRQPLRVGISAAIARSTSPKFLMPLLRLEGHPLTIRLVQCTDLLRELRAGLIDLVICENTPPEVDGTDLDTILIKTLKLVAIAAPCFQIADDWQGAPLIQYGPGSRVRAAILEFLDARGLKPSLIAEADDGNFLVEVAATGGHLVIVPESVARDAISTERVRVLASIALDNAGVYAIHRRTTSVGIVRDAIDLMIETHGNRQRL